MKRTDAVLTYSPLVQASLAGIGARIKETRKAQGMSMERLGELMMCTRHTVKRLEAGDPGVSIGVLAAALDALQMARTLGGVARTTPHDFGGGQE